LNKVYGNLMVDLKATNAKLVRRAIRLTSFATGADEDAARATLEACGFHVKTAIVALSKQTSVEQAQALLEAARGEKIFSDAVRDYLATRQHSASPFRQLTERERDVLQEVARGLSNKEIAAALHISEETVKVHIRNLLKKLDVRSRVAATVMWLESRNS